MLEPMNGNDDPDNRNTNRHQKEILDSSRRRKVLATGASALITSGVAQTVSGQSKRKNVGVAYNPASDLVLGDAEAEVSRGQSSLRGTINVLGESIPVKATAVKQLQSPDGPVKKFDVGYKNHRLRLAAGTDGIGGRISKHFVGKQSQIADKLVGTAFTVARSDEYTRDDIAEPLGGK